MSDVTIHLQEEEETALHARIEGTNFESIEEYIQFVIQEIVSTDSIDEDSHRASNRTIEDRLEALGYR